MTFIIAVIMSHVVDLFFYPGLWSRLIVLMIFLSLRYFISAADNLIFPLGHWLSLFNRAFLPVNWLFILVVILLLRILNRLEVTLKIIVMPLRLLAIIVSIIVTIVSPFIMLFYRLFILVVFFRPSF